MHNDLTPLENNEFSIALSTPTGDNSGKNKRKYDFPIDRSNNDIYTYLKNMNNSIANEIKSMRQEVSCLIDSKLDGLNENIVSINQEIHTVKKSTSDNAEQINANKKTINYLQQEKLQNLMEIHGACIDSTLSKNDLKTEVKRIIESFQIKIDTNKIKSASVMNIGAAHNSTQQPKKIVIVEFTDIETKIRVMKEKRKMKEHLNIYFNHRLTSDNRKLMAKAKKLASEKNFKCFMNYNKIYLKKSDEARKIIECDSDIQEAYNWSPNPKSSHA